MKLIVDEMPKCARECPFSVDICCRLTQTKCVYKDGGCRRLITIGEVMSGIFTTTTVCTNTIDPGFYIPAEQLNTDHDELINACVDKAMDATKTFSFMK